MQTLMQHLERRPAMKLREENTGGKRSRRFLIWSALAVMLMLSFLVRAGHARGAGKVLTIKKQYIEALEISNDSELEKVTVVYGEALKKISIENCENLNSLIVSKNMSLEEISIKNCSHLKSIMIKDNVVLERFRMEGSQKINELVIKNNDMLESVLPDKEIHPEKLQVMENERLKILENVDLSKVKELKMTEVPRLKFKGKDFPRLEYLAYDNSFSGQIDFHSSKKLRKLEVQKDKKKKVLDIAKFPKLESLSWKEGVLEKVRFGKKGKLRKIDLRNNRLSGNWNMDGFKKLHTLNLSHNRLTSLDMGKLKQEICIYCADNRLKVFRAWNYSQVPELHFQKNPGLRAYLAFDEECCLWIFDKSAKMFYRYS